MTQHHKLVLTRQNELVMIYEDGGAITLLSWTPLRQCWHYRRVGIIGVDTSNFGGYGVALNFLGSSTQPAGLM